jgi:hypothetical protein
MTATDHARSYNLDPRPMDTDRQLPAYLILQATRSARTNFLIGGQGGIEPPTRGFSAPSGN